MTKLKNKLIVFPKNIPSRIGIFSRVITSEQERIIQKFEFEKSKLFNIKDQTQSRKTDLDTIKEKIELEKGKIKNNKISSNKIEEKEIKQKAKIKNIEQKKEKVKKKEKKEIESKLLTKKEVQEIINKKEKMITKNKNKIFRKMNLKKSFFANAMKTFSVFIFIFVMILGQLVSPQVASAATYTFSQGSWAGGSSATTATHGSNQSNWTQYSAVSGLTTGATTAITPSALSNTQTATGDFTGTTSQTAVASGSVSVARSGSNNAKVVSGHNATYVLKTDGTVWSYGADSYASQLPTYQLGDGSTGIARKTPTQVFGLTNVVDISADGFDAYAVKSDGTVWGWGVNNGAGIGQLGDGGSTNRFYPVQITALSGITHISSGTNALSYGGSSASLTQVYNENYAIRGSDGTVWTWGGNNSYRGDGIASATQTPAQVLKGAADPANVCGAYLCNISKVVTSGQAAYALTTTGDVLAWGDGVNGDVGDGTGAARSSPVKVVKGQSTSGTAYMTGASDIAIVGGASAGSWNLTQYTAGYALIGGNVYSWGYNGHGQLGINTTDNQNSPVQVKGVGGSGGLTGITTLGNGVHAAFAASATTAYSWGLNTYGNIGNNSTTESTTPVAISTISGITSISGNELTSAAIDSTGALWSWGYNAGYHVGDNSTTERHVPVHVQDYSRSNFSVGTGTVAISGGANFSYALKNDGTVWAWGRNNAGQLGDGTTTNSDFPVQVSGLTGITGIASSADGNSGYAIGSGGSVYAWGSNAWGQLGIATTSTSQSTPVQVHGPGNVGYLSGITSIAVGGNTTYFMKADGTVYATGLTNSGEAGTGSSYDNPGAGASYDNTGCDNQYCDNSTPGNVYYVTPIQVYAAGSTVTAIAAGDSSGYARKSNGNVYAWGLNSSYQLGDGTVTARVTPVQVSTITNVTSLAGGTASAYALKSDNTVWAWGLGTSGQLGNNLGTTSGTPVQVSTVTGVTAIAAGNSSGYALKSDGSVWSWGLNTSYQLGDGTVTQRNAPVQVSGLTSGVAAIAGSYISGYALKSDGTIVAWGDNTYGQIGDMTRVLASTPRNVLSRGSIANFAAGLNAYYSSGTYTSNVIDLTGLAGLTTLSYTTTLNSQTLTVDVRAGDSSSVPAWGATDSNWTSTGMTNVASGADISSLGQHRYIQYRVTLNSDGVSSPTLDSITVNYNQYTAGTLTSNVYDTADATNLIGKVAWTATGTTSNETVRFQVRSSADNITWTGWCGYADTSSSCGGSNYFNSNDAGTVLSNGNTTFTDTFQSTSPLRNGANDRYVQYKAYLGTGGAATPTLSNASVIYVINLVPVFNPDYPTTGAGGVTASQNSNSGSADFAKVNISFSAKDTDTDTAGNVTRNQILPSFEYSTDGGSSWHDIPSGDLAAGNTSLQTILGGSYTLYTATWNSIATVPSGISVSNAKIRVKIDDSEAANNWVKATTANFSLDTTAPTGSISFDAGLAGVTNSATVTIPMPTDLSAVQYKITDCTDLTGGCLSANTSTNSASGVWTSIVGSTTIPWTFDSTIGAKSLKYQWKDAFGNTSTEQVVSTQVPIASSSFIVQDTSNVSTGSYDMYLGWSAADATGFSSYKLEYSTSTDNVTFGSYTTIVSSLLNDVNSNYFVHRTLDTTKYYRYRIAVVGTNGNTSVRSGSYLTAKPDGVQNYSEGGGGSVAAASKVENVVVTQNNDKTVSATYKLTDTSITKKTSPSYEAAIFYNIGITLPANPFTTNHLTVSDASKLKTTGYVMVNNEVIKYTSKSGNILSGLTRSTWPTDISPSRTTRTNTVFFAGTPVWIFANGTPTTIANNSIVTGQDNSINWNTGNESALIGNTYSNVSIRVVVHDNQDSLSGPLSTQNDYSENGILTTLDLTAPAISFSATTGNGAESVTPAVLTVNLDRAYALDSTVNYTLSGTATGGTDYTLSNGTITVTAGQTSANLNIPIIDDTLKENNETIIVTLSSPVNAVLGTNTVYTYTINDNDTGPAVQFDATSGSGLQSVSPVSIPVSISGTSGTSSTVDYTLSGTSTGGGVDYTLANGTVTIPAGQTTANISLAVVNTHLQKSDQTVILTLSNPTNVTLGTNTVYTYTISSGVTLPTVAFVTTTGTGKEDVSSVDIPVSISASYADSVTVDYSANGGTAVGGGADYTLTNGTLTIAAGQVTGNIHMTISNDNIYEPDKTVIVTLSNPSNATIGTNSTFTYTIVDSSMSVTGVGNAVKATSAVITWTTGDYTDSFVEYTTNLADPMVYDHSKTKDSNFVLSHSVYLGGLTPSTHYYVQTTSTDTSGIPTIATSEFTTTAGPVISNVNSSGITDTKAVITWTTDIPATSYVSYSTDATMASPTRQGTADLVTDHSVTLIALNAASTYHYFVDSTDGSTNCSSGPCINEDKNLGNYYDFATSADVTPPEISAVSTPVLTPRQAAIVWTTNEFADGKVMYDTVSHLTSGSYTYETTLITTPMTSHLAVLSGLEPTVKYYYVVVSADTTGNSKTSDEYSFTTPAVETVVVGGGGTTTIGVAQSLYDALLAENAANKSRSGLDNTPPTISNIQVSAITSFTAVISFETSESTIAFVEYGKDHTYGKSEGDSAWATTHSIKLSGLTLGSDYFFKIKVVDRGNNETSSDEQTFKTKFFSENLADLKKIDNVAQYQSEIEATIESILPSLVPPFVDKPVISDITENGATVTFNTNIKAYPVVSYATDTSYDVTKDNPYNGEMSDTTAKGLVHSLVLTNLKPNTTYHVMAKAFSLPQVVGKSEDVTFNTAASKIQGSVIDVKKDSFTVVWTTDEPTSSIIDYKNLKTGISTRLVDDIKNTSHSVLIRNLSPGVSYEVSISGVNDKGNTLLGGTPITIKTSVDVTPPAITNIKVDSALIVGRTDRVQTIVSWTTDEPSTSTVFYEEGSGSPDKALANKQEDLGLVTNHAVILTTLKPGTVYRFTIASTDNANNTAMPPIRTIITPQKVESIVDIIFKNFDQTFNFVKNVR